jgi:large subunit ribosomal protein L18e
MTVKSNPATVRLIAELRKVSTLSNAPVWKYVAELMEKPESRWAEVNVGKLDEYAKENCAVIVPGKLLGDGVIRKPLSVTAFRYSASARKKVVDAGGSLVSITEILEKNPKGTGLLILK